MRLHNKRLSKSKSLVLAAVVAVTGMTAVGNPIAANAMNGGSVMNNQSNTPINGPNVANNNSDNQSDQTETNGLVAPKNDSNMVQELAMQQQNMQNENMQIQREQIYVAVLHPINKTNVSGTAKFSVEGNHLKATIDATGLEPGVHPQHIHGKKQAKAECPTQSADTNNDGFISVIEGAPSYGLIKMNLTSPQTAFGTPPTPVLFESFAGTADNKNFPVVKADGILHFQQTYTFDNSASAQAALASLTPLGSQEVVIHGATAPKSVDADAFALLGSPVAAADLTTSSYDALLPVACGEISAVSGMPHHDNNKSQDNNDHPNSGNAPDTSAIISPLNSGLNTLQTQLTDGLTAAAAAGHGTSADFNGKVSSLSAALSASVTQAVSTYQMSIASGTNRDEARNQLINSLASAKDTELNGLTEARNQMVDQLNQSGDVAYRDAFLNGFDHTVLQYRNVLEMAKNQL